MKGTIRYSGLGVRLRARATYGGDRMTYGIAQRGADGSAERQPAPAHAKYWSAAAGATLPLYFDRASYPTARLGGWEYSNGMVADVDAIRYDAEGRIANLQTLGLPRRTPQTRWASASDVVRRLPRRRDPLGYTLWAGYDLNPKTATSATSYRLTPGSTPPVLSATTPLRSGGLPNLRRRLPLPVGLRFSATNRPGCCPGLLLVRHFEQ